MEKLTFGQLSAARANPAAFKASLAQKQIFTYSYMQLLQNLILRMHKKNWTRQQAATALQADLDKHFPNPRRHAEILASFDKYCDEFAALGSVVASTRLKGSVELLDGSSTYVVSGSVPRLDLASDGNYLAVLFCNEAIDANQDVRLVFAQLAASRTLGVPPDTVVPGLYDFERQRHEFIAVSPQERSSVLVEFTQLFRKLQ